MNYVFGGGRVLASLLFVVQLFCTVQGSDQFAYRFQTEVVHGDAPGFAFPHSLSAFAKHQFAYLNASLFFEPSFIKDTKKTREYHLRDQYLKSRRGQLREFLADDGTIIYGTYFDRGSDKLLLIGEGFTNAREVMSPFIDMFPDYDLVIFDFRGQGLEAGTFSLSKRCFGVDTGYAKLGAVEELDVFAVIDGMKKNKNYAQIYGLGVCYSAFIFLKAAALRPGLFDKLILDGCWVSVPLIVEKIRADLKLICNPQHGGWKDHWLLSDTTVQEVLMWICVNILSLPLNEISLLDYLDRVNDLSILFFHGKDDLMVYRNEFESIWRAIKTTKKTAIITSNPHVRNHLKQKEEYRLLCELFLNHNYEKFKEFIANPKAVATMYSDQVLNFVT